MNQPDKKRIITSPYEWLAHARSDLNFALLGHKNSDIMNEQICFHAQQAVEKALKAVLLFHKIDFPLTHDLDELSDILQESGVSLPEEVTDVGSLTPYAVETRYPGYWSEITDQDVDEALKMAEQVVKWSGDIIPKDETGN